jgi:hypothetical protein
VGESNCGGVQESPQAHFKEHGKGDWPKRGEFLPRRQVISLSFSAWRAFSWVRKARFVCTIVATQYWPSLH